MADVFYHADAKTLLKKKHIIFFGDSNTRAVYKDLVWLLNSNSLISQSHLKRKQEPSFSGDKLGKHSELNRGREYEEERTYEKDGTRVDFYFITRCYNPLLIDVMEDIHLGLREPPDVIYINSTFWDVCRWGPDGVTLFKDNVYKLARLFKSSLPVTTLVIWATALPVSHNVQSSLLIKQIDFLRHSLRFDVLEANQFARDVMATHGFDVLDNHFHMRMQIHRRVHDGVHYMPIAIRLLTNLLLTHIALSWDFELPNRVETILLDKAKAQAAPNSKQTTLELNSPKILSNKAKKNKLAPSKQGPMQNNNNVNNKPNNYKGRKKRFPKQRNHNTSFNIPPHQPRVKTVNRNHWAEAAGVDEQRGWSGTNTHNMPVSSVWSPWANNNFPQQPNWSEDHWPDEPSQRFSDEPHYNNEHMFNNTLDNNRYGFMLNNITSAETMRYQLLQKYNRSRLLKNLDSGTLKQNCSAYATLYAYTADKCCSTQKVFLSK